MNRDDVRYFLDVRAARSIKGTARALKVDHTTVSRRLAALEIALGASLFERTPDGLVETDVGRAVAPVAERMEVVAAEITEAAHAASDSLAGPVRIATTPRLSDVIGQWDRWLVTNPEARSNARVQAVKEAVVELLEAAGERLSGGKREPERE